jgi:acylphosphatase
VSAPVIKRVVVRGRVQGVGFRAFVEEEAWRRHLAGWVRNRRDGSVEAVLAGPFEAVDAALAALRKGPPSARVDAVDVEEGNEQDLRQRPPGEVFAVLRTV